ncbi:hypothetical protein D3C73_1528900 [compost metagenome]
MNTAQQFAGVGQGIRRDQVAVNGEIRGGEAIAGNIGIRWIGDDLLHGLTPSQFRSLHLNPSHKIRVAAVRGVRNRGHRKLGQTEVCPRTAAITWLL